jgi:hypothetical protein
MVARMSKPRVTTDEQCKELADWWWDLKHMGTVRSKAKEMGISVQALYDSISRGLNQPTSGMRFKLRDVSRESIQTECKDEVA